MAKEVRAKPEEIANLAGETLEASIELGDALRDAQPSLSVPAAAFGNAPVGAGVQRAHQAFADDASTAVGRLVGVHEGDVDRLYQVAFAYQQADREAAAALARANRQR
jgi:hypothetical protein